MKRIGPLLKMTFALVALCGTLVMLADVFFGVLPDRQAQRLALRKSVSEALSVQIAALIEGDNERALQRTISHVVSRTEGVQSLGLRRADGSLLMQAGDHAKAWRGGETDLSTLDQVSVALQSGGKPWGTFEIAFKEPAQNVILRQLNEPMVITLLFISCAGTVVFALYLRRTLQHLDPSSVIPERVQGAFDVMTEGVVVLDARARVMLANKAFRGMHADAEKLQLGHPLSTLPWLAEALPEDGSAHPWARDRKSVV